MAGAFDGFLSRPWQRAVAAELIAHDKVPVSLLLEHVTEHRRPPASRNRVHAEADRRHVLRKMLERLAEHGAIEVPECFACGYVTVRDRFVLERVAHLQAVTVATNPSLRRKAATYPAPEPLRLIRGGAA